MFSPGSEVSRFTSRKGKQVVIRFATIDDVQAMTDYMNELSREDTYITLSGEQVRLEDQHSYLASLLTRMQTGDAAKLFAYVEDTMVANADLTRMIRRSQHYGLLSISVKKEFRDEGIGTEIMRVFLGTARQMKLLSIQLSLFATNDPAKNLYRRFGFVEVGRLPKKLSYKGELIDEIIMVKHL